MIEVVVDNVYQALVTESIYCPMEDLVDLVLPDEVANPRRLTLEEALEDKKRLGEMIRIYYLENDTDWESREIETDSYLEDCNILSVDV